MTKTARRIRAVQPPAYTDLKPYTIITRRADAPPQHIIGNFNDDDEAIRRTHYYLGFYRATSARLYRGYHSGETAPPGKAVVQIRAPQSWC